MGSSLRLLSSGIRGIDNESIVVLLFVLLLTVIDVIVWSHGRSLVLDLYLVCLSTDRLPPLVGNDRGRIDLIVRPPMHVRDSCFSRSLSMFFTLLLSWTRRCSVRFLHFHGDVSRWSMLCVDCRSRARRLLTIAMGLNVRYVYDVVLLAVTVVLLFFVPFCSPVAYRFLLWWKSISVTPVYPVVCSCMSLGL